jgi:hypothetical protein
LKSDEIKARADRYNRVEREADVWGRIIGVRRLKGSEEMRIIGMTPDVDGTEPAIVVDDKTGMEKTIQIAKRAPFFIAAMVCEVDGIPFTFPKTRGELDSVFDRLDREGRDAAVKAIVRMETEDKGDPELEQQESIETEAKN